MVGIVIKGQLFAKKDARLKLAHAMREHAKNPNQDVSIYTARVIESTYRRAFNCDVYYIQSFDGKSIYVKKRNDNAIKNVIGL